MKTYLISYDLGGPETSDDYKKLINHIKSYPTWAKPHYSVWFIKSDKSTSAVRDDLKQYVDGNDSILVIEITGDDWGTWRISKEVTDWMNTNI